LGGAFLLRVLEQSNIQINAAILVAAPLTLDNPEFEAGDKPFIGHPFDWNAITKNCKQFFVFQSDNDTIVKLINGEKIAAYLGIELTRIPNSGHFNKQAGYLQFPQLLEKIKPVL
jgi:predicted alpha/beta hydrolase family esterase